MMMSLIFMNPGERFRMLSSLGEMFLVTDGLLAFIAYGYISTDILSTNSDSSSSTVTPSLSPVQGKEGA